LSNNETIASVNHIDAPAVMYVEVPEGFKNINLKRARPLANYKHEEFLSEKKK